MSQDHGRTQRHRGKEAIPPLRRPAVLRIHMYDRMSQGPSESCLGTREQRRKGLHPPGLASLPEGRLSTWPAGGWGPSGEGMAGGLACSVTLSLGDSELFVKRHCAKCPDPRSNRPDPRRQMGSEPEQRSTRPRHRAPAHGKLRPRGASLMRPGGGGAQGGQKRRQGPQWDCGRPQQGAGGEKHSQEGGCGHKKIPIMKGPPWGQGHVEAPASGCGPVGHRGPYVHRHS